MFEHFLGEWAYVEPNLFDELCKVLSDGFLDGFWEFRFFIVKICILIWYFFENFSMRMLSIRGNGFIACWPYAEPISSHTEHRGMNFRACSASGKMWTAFTCEIHAEHTRNEFYHTLSIHGTNFIACSAYAEPISSHAEHARKWLKGEYLGRIKYDFQKSRVTGPWDDMVSISAKKV